MADSTAAKKTAAKKASTTTAAAKKAPAKKAAAKKAAGATTPARFVSGWIPNWSSAVVTDGLGALTSGVDA